MLVEKFLNAQLVKLPEGVNGCIPNINDLKQIAGLKRLVLLSGSLMQEGNLFMSQLYATQDQTMASKQRTLQIVGSLAQYMRQSAYDALIAASQESKLPLREVEIDSLNENGVVGRLDQTWYILGNDKMLSDHGMEPGITFQTISRQMENEGKVVLYLAQRQPKRILGLMACDRNLQESAVESVKKLGSLGIEVVLLTGLKTSTAKGLAQRMGIHLVHSELSDVEKKMINDSFQDNEVITGFLHDSKTKTLVPKTALSILRTSQKPKEKLWSKELADIPAMVEYSRFCMEKAKKKYFWCKI